MVHIPPPLADRARDRHGVVPDADFARFGVSARQRRRLAEAQVIVRMHNGVYRIRSSPDTFEARCVAACAAHPRLVIAGMSAGRLWGFRGLPRELRNGPVTAAVVREGQVRLSGVQVRRTAHLPPNDTVERPDGIMLTSPVRTWLDLGHVLDDRSHESILEQLLDERTCTLATLLTARRRWAVPGRWGVARVNRVLGERAAGSRPAGSADELRVLAALAARGIPLVRQLPIALPNGVTIHADLADPRIEWIVEIDHFAWHAGRQATRRDKARDRQLHLLGWQVERIDNDALDDDFDAVIDELAVLHRRRAVEVLGPGWMAGASPAR